MVTPEISEVTEGDKAEFMSKAKGKPIPKIIWSKNGQPLEKAKGFKITSFDDDYEFESESKLVMNSAERSDPNVYQIEAKNHVGSAFHEFSLQG